MTDTSTDLERIAARAREAVAAAASLAAIEELKVEFLGKKGSIHGAAEVAGHARAADARRDAGAADQCRARRDHGR